MYKYSSTGVGSIYIFSLSDILLWKMLLEKKNVFNFTFFREMADLSTAWLESFVVTVSKHLRFTCTRHDHSKRSQLTFVIYYDSLRHGLYIEDS